MNIKQGDAYSLKFHLYDGETELDDLMLAEVEVCLGDINKTLSSGEITYNDGFYFPLTQEETLALNVKPYVLQVRVKYNVTGTVVGADEIIDVTPTVSKVVL